VVTKRTYSVSLADETIVRQALLLKNTGLLQLLEKSTAVYGEEGAEALSYKTLAVYDLKHRDPPLSSVEMYLRTAVNKE
jgi:hypothetical protein